MGLPGVSGGGVSDELSGAVPSDGAAPTMSQFCSRVIRESPIRKFDETPSEWETGGGGTYLAREESLHCFSLGNSEDLSWIPCELCEPLGSWVDMASVGAS